MRDYGVCTSQAAAADCVLENVDFAAAAADRPRLSAEVKGSISPLRVKWSFYPLQMRLFGAFVDVVYKVAHKFPTEWSFVIVCVWWSILTGFAMACKWWSWIYRYVCIYCFIAVFDVLMFGARVRSEWLNRELKMANFETHKTICNAISSPCYITQKVATVAKLLNYWNRAAKIGSAQFQTNPEQC